MNLQLKAKLKKKFYFFLLIRNDYLLPKKFYTQISKIKSICDIYFPISIILQLIIIIENMRILLISIFITLLLAQPSLWPLPKNINISNHQNTIIVSPCQVSYKVSSPIFDYVANAIDFYLDSVFHCQQKTPKNYTLSVIVRSSNMTLPTETGPQSYSLTIRESGRWELSADYYVGFLRGLETYSQLLQRKGEDYAISNIPIVIDDEPQFKWRGLMIDSSRHFLPLAWIKKTINGLMFNKMNILHWHITDEDSFPLQVTSVPELSQYGKVGGTYNATQIRQVVSYAKLKGVRVIIEVDTPAHTQSWGRSKKYRENIVRCSNEYSGQFDPTLDSTYELVSEVFKFINNTFQDNYVHFGGDQISGLCWDLKPKILEWMIQHRMLIYKDLQIYYRKRQKSLWRSISLKKKAIYWTNEQLNLPLQSDDVLHWWGQSSHLHLLVGKPNEVILSNNDHAYIDKGYGNRNGFPYGHLINWRDMYHFNPRVQGVNVIGGETCMWSELSNSHTHEQKIWIRTSVYGERLWNDKVDLKTQLPSIASRLSNHAQRMRQRGHKVSPVTVQLCEEESQICFK